MLNSLLVNRKAYYDFLYVRLGLVYSVSGGLILIIFCTH